MTQVSITVDGKEWKENHGQTPKGHIIIMHFAGGVSKDHRVYAHDKRLRGSNTLRRQNMGAIGMRHS